MTTWRTRPRPSEPRRRETAEPTDAAVAAVAAQLWDAAARGRNGWRGSVAGADPRAVALAAGPVLVELVARAWVQGWQPGELHWHVRRRQGAAEADLLRAAVRAEASTRAAHEVHPAWRTQLEALGVELPARAAPPSPRWLRHEADLPPIRTALLVIFELAEVPRLPLLLPPPGRPDLALDGAAMPADVEGAGIDQRVLERVRALLAKAESTTFEAEAQAFTAKAHELMTRHALEHAVVAGTDDRSRPLTRRLLLDDPYVDVKALLVQVLAEACRCRAVSHRPLAMASVVGFEGDIAGLEVLFTSLLVQAQTVLQDLARVTPPGSRERSRGFRSSFLHGFVHRIGPRLARGGEAAVAEVDRTWDGALLPVLASRRADVDAEVARAFPRLVTQRRRGPTDALGFQAGEAAAERADLPWSRLAAPR